MASSGNVSNKYRILLQALIDEKAVDQQIKDLNKKKFSIDVNLNLSNAELDKLKTQINNLKQSLRTMGSSGSGGGLQLFDEKTVSTIAALEQRVQQLKQTTQQPAKLEIQTNVFQGVEKTTSAILTYTNQIGQTYREKWLPVLEEVNGVMQPTGEMELRFVRYVQDAVTQEKAALKVEQERMGVLQTLAKEENKIFDQQKAAEEKAKRDQLAVIQEVANAENKAFDKRIKDFNDLNLQADKFLSKSKNLNQNDPNVSKGINTANALKSAVSSKDIDTAQRLGKELKVIDEAVRSGGKNLQSWATEIGVAIKRTVEWAVGIGLVYGAFNQLKSGVQYLNDLNKELTNVQLVTGQTKSEVSALALSYNQLATELGTTTLEVARGSLEWLRQGKTAEETQALLRSSLMMSKLAAVDSATATEDLTAITNGFKISAKDTIDVVDKLVAVDNASATSVAELAESLKRSSNIAQETGISFDKLVSYIATVSSVTRKSADTVGTAFQSMFVRMSNIKMGRLDEDGSSINDVETALARVNIKLRDSDDEFRNFSDVLDEVHSKWADLTEIERASIAQAVSGTRNRENFLVLMNNYNEALRLQSVEAQSAGLANKRYADYMDNVEAASNRSKAAWEKFWMTLMNSDVTKYFYDMSTSVLTAATSINEYLVPAIIALGTAIAIMNSKAIGSGIIGFLTNLSGIGTTLTTLATNITMVGEAAGFASALTSGLSITFGAVAVTTGAVIAIIGAIVGVVYEYNKAITETQKKGYDQTLSTFGKMFDDLRAKNTDATSAVKTYTDAMNSMVEAYDKLPWYLKIFVNSQTLQNQGLKQAVDYLNQNKNGYGDYKKNLEDVAAASGYLVDENNKLYREFRDSNGILRRQYIELKTLTDAEVNAALGAEDMVREQLHANNAAQASIKVFEGLSKALKSMADQSAATNAIIKKANEGKADFQDVQSIIDTYPNYLEALKMEGGQIKINTDLLRQWNIENAQKKVDEAVKNNASAEDVAILQNYVDQLRRGTPISKEFTSTFDKMLVNSGNMLEKTGDLNDSFKTLATTMGSLNKAYKLGEISSSEYFKSINKGLKDLNFDKTFNGNKDAAQTFFSGLTLDAAQAFSQISSEFDSGNIALSEYTKSLEEMGGVFQTIGQFALDYSDDLGIVGAQANEMQGVVGNALSNISSATQALGQLQETNALMDQMYYQINQQGLEFGTEAYNEFAQKLADAAAKSGVAIQDINGNVLNGSKQIFDYLTAAPENLGIVADQTAQATGNSINKMVQAVGGLLVELGKSIQSFSAKIDFQPVVGNKMTKVPIRIMGMPVANFAEIPDMSLAVTGSSTSLESIGNAITTFGQNLQSSTTGSNFDRGIYQAPAAMNQVTGSANGATDALKDLNKAIKDSGGAAKDAANSMNDLLKMVEEKIKQEKEAEKDKLKDQLDGYKAIIDKRKELLKSYQEEADYQDDLKAKQKDLASIQAEILELSLDDSEEARAKRLQLEDQEAKQKDDLNKTQRDHSVKAQTEALDNELKTFEDMVNEKIKAIDEYLKEPGRIAQDAIALINAKGESLYQDLINWNRIYGTGIDNDVTKAWEGAYAVLDKYKNNLGQIDFQYALSQLENIQSSAASTVGAINSAISAAETLQAIQNNTLPSFGSGATSDVAQQEINYHMDLNGNGIIGRHTGVDSGFVGGLNSNEEFAKLMKGELVINPNQMNRFINTTMPQIIKSSAAGAGMKFDKLIELNVQGNLDQSVLPDVQDVVERAVEKLNKMMNQRGYLRNANSFSI